MNAQSHKVGSSSGLSVYVMKHLNLFCIIIRVCVLLNRVDGTGKMIL